MGPLPMALLLVVSFAAFGWSAWRRWRLMLVARRHEHRADRLGERLAGVGRFVFGQQRMPRYFAAGWAHILVFFGFLVLLLNSIMLWVRGFTTAGPAADLWLFGLDQPLGMAYALLRDLFTVLVLLGVLVFFYNRAIARLPRLTLSGEGLLILGIIFTMMIADLLYEGGELLHHRAAHPGTSTFHAALPFASATALLLAPLPTGVQDFLWQAGYWAHSVLVLLFLNLLPYGKHFHVVTVVPNVFARALTPRGRVRPIDDIEGRLEREETLGAKRIADFSWKDVLDFYTCTECGRCSDQCPATRTGKLLSPKHLLTGLRDHLYARERHLTAPARAAADAAGHASDAAAPTQAVAAADPAAVDPPGRPHGTRDRHALRRDPAAPALLAVDELVPAWVNPETLWACTTCAACEEECPVFITYIDKIVDLRRNLVLEQGAFPEQLQTAFRGLETVGNPYSYPNEQRAEWAQGLDVPLRAEKPDAEYLYWVGCAASFDDRARKIARALAQLLKTAGVSFAILGPEEVCNGDPARRAGNEYLFQMLAKQNIETLNRYNVRKIITACPHCYNTLKNEYPDFGGNYEVVHHSTLLAELVRNGRLRPRTPVAATIALHDACYLGRHNGVYDAPRAVLAALPGARLVEPPETRDRGMCCGAGGAQMWKEEEHGTARVNHARTNQLLRVLPSNGDGRTIASACPFCKTMLSDGLTDQGHDTVRQLDIAELLWEAVQPAVAEA